MNNNNHVRIYSFHYEQELKKIVVEKAARIDLFSTKIAPFYATSI